MDYFKEAEILRELSMKGNSQTKLAMRCGHSQSYISNKIRLLKFTDEEKEVIKKANLPERIARTLLSIRDVEERKRALGVIIREKMNVRQADEYIDRVKDSLISKQNVSRETIR